MKTAASLALIALLTAVAAHAAPAVIAHDARGVVVNADFAKRYAELCQQYPSFGDKPGDGVMVLDVDRFHVDSKHYLDYLNMVTLDQQAKAKQEKVASGSSFSFLGLFSR